MERRPGALVVIKTDDNLWFDRQNVGWDYEIDILIGCDVWYVIWLGTEDIRGQEVAVFLLGGDTIIWGSLSILRDPSRFL